MLAGIVDPGEVLCNVVDGIWEVLREADGFVYDSWYYDHDEGDNTADDNSVGNSDWEFVAFAWD